MGQDPAAALRTPQAEQMLEAIANRLGSKLEVVVRDQVRQEVLPRLDEMEGKIETIRRADTPRPPQLRDRTDEQDLQRRALDRVD